MPRPPRLLVIDPSIVWPEEEGAREAICDFSGDVVRLYPALRPGDGPGPGDGYDADGVVVLGSRASVHDEYPWLGALGDWLDPILRGDESVPVLGICFGHQLIAHRAGGLVGYLHPDRRQELGVRETTFEGSRLAPGTFRMKVVVSHGECVERVPAGFRAVARRDGVPIDALEHEQLPVFSVQFHPEARAEFLTRRGADPSPLDDRAVADNVRFLASFRKLLETAT